MTDPKNYVIATVPNRKSDCECDPEFAMYIKTLSQKTFQFNKYSQQNDLIDRVSKTIYDSTVKAPKLHKEMFDFDYGIPEKPKSLKHLDKNDLHLQIMPVGKKAREMRELKKI